MNFKNKIGLLKWFNRDQGLALIIPSDGSKEVVWDIVLLDKAQTKQYKKLEDGQKVAFKVERGHKVMSAFDVVLM
ncbi:cold shock domain-containing protein [Neisseria sp. Ec49-e6-T10]|uniref:cold shock domain-containing protein n=1 Tax=Neisseria sp. Ec49-e6-T10 TaxID=3140744 RepID=UPI003EBB3D11